jgi:dipeptidase E
VPAAPHELPLAKRTILALGGHEFSRKKGNEAIRDHMLELAAGSDPRRLRVCLLPTASGDPADQISAFRSSFAGLPCSLSHVSLFRLETEAVDLAAHLLDQDLIYVGGGSMLNLLAVWRAHHIDEVLTDCWRRGVVLAGQSAGAMCWFECGVTRSAGSAKFAPGLGLVPGVLSVHYHRDADRRQTLLEQAGTRGIRGYGIDDGAGVVVRGDEIVEAFTGHEGPAVWRVEPDGQGGATETRMPTQLLESPRPAIDEIPDAVFELRAVRALRSGRL